MISFLLQRLAQAVAVMLVVLLVSFSLFNFVGDPVNNMVGDQVSTEQRDAIRERLGLDQPVTVQFYHFVGSAVQGEFGISYRTGQPVSEMIMKRMPATIELSLFAALLALAGGISLGVYTALRRDTWLSKILSVASLIGVSLPTFLIGILLILIFSVWLGWLPSFGRGETLDLGWWSTGLFTWSGIKALIMPAVTLALFQLTLVMRLVRSEMLEVLRADYIRFAHARGMSNRAVYFSYALRNTMLPVITVAGLQIGNIVAFSIVVETVFQWPGLGYLIIQAIHFADVPVMAAYLMFIALLFVTTNLIVDILYLIVDPRLRADRSVAREIS